MKKSLLLRLEHPDDGEYRDYYCRYLKLPLYNDGKFQILEDSDYGHNRVLASGVDFGDIATSYHLEGGTFYNDSYELVWGRLRDSPSGKRKGEPRTQLVVVKSFNNGQYQLYRWHCGSFLSVLEHERTYISTDPFQHALNLISPLQLKAERMNEVYAYTDQQWYKGVRGFKNQYQGE